jgi:hypothetical protein
LAASHPEDFERIDAARHWAGVLAMRGAAVQHLADFPDDADATSLLLRLALQAGTPCTQLAARELVPESWMLADSPAAVARHGTALIASAAPPADWYAPGLTLASTLVRALVPRGLGQGAPVVGGTGFALLLAAVLIAAFGPAAGGLGLAVIGAFLVQVDHPSFACSITLGLNQLDSCQNIEVVAYRCMSFLGVFIWAIPKQDHVCFIPSHASAPPILTLPLSQSLPSFS